MPPTCDHAPYIAPEGECSACDVVRHRFRKVAALRGDDE